MATFPTLPVLQSLPAAPSLMGVPPEIRDKIYNCLLPDEGSVYTLCPNRWDEPEQKTCPVDGEDGKKRPCDLLDAHQCDSDQSGVFGLLLSCRRIYLEIINMLYTRTQINTFSPYAAMNFFQTIGPLNTMALKNFAFQLNPPHSGAPEEWCAFFKALLESPVGATGGRGPAARHDWDRQLHFVLKNPILEFWLDKETKEIRYRGVGTLAHLGQSLGPRSNCSTWRIQIFVLQAPFADTDDYDPREYIRKGEYAKKVLVLLSTRLHDREAYNFFTEQFRVLFEDMEAGKEDSSKSQKPLPEKQTPLLEGKAPYW
ncbi:hypothetical protein V8F20_006937 [Naviculisporaceae sp. PSN 640]